MENHGFFTEVFVTRVTKFSRCNKPSIFNNLLKMIGASSEGFFGGIRQISDCELQNDAEHRETH